jgi:DNA topoisomerase-1
MVISEKPTAAKKLAVALDERGTPEEIKKTGASYFKCLQSGDTIIVAYALGHLFELKQTLKGWNYPRLEAEWVPKYEVDKKAANVKPIISLIRKLAKDVDEFIVATDYDIEGSLIGFLTLKYACGANPEAAKRMVFSTLTVSDLQKAYDTPRESLDFPMIYAGQVRHEVDWLYGINLTRALTLAIKKTSGWFRIVSTGRIQGPVLALVAERDREINVFVPVPYWTISSKGIAGRKEIPLEYSEARINRLKVAEEIVEELKEKDGRVVGIKKNQFVQKPPVPFNLSGLQSECYRHFGFNPSRTLALAQNLYVEGLISYPRTSSQQIPASIDVKGILQKLANRKSYQKHIKSILDRGNLQPAQGKTVDPAHPAIHPTGDEPTRKLTPSEGKVYDIVIRRFLALFGATARKERIRVDIQCDRHLFYARGLRVLEAGWMDLYGTYATSNENILPELKVGDCIHIRDVLAEARRTSPPRRYNPSSLLKALEKERLGTKATRAAIVDSARSRGYTLNDKFEMSTLGYALFETLQTYVPTLLSPEFTRGLEAEMDVIQEEKTDKDLVLSHAKEELTDLLDTFKLREDEIGEALVTGLRRFWRESEELGTCPKCGDGRLIVIRSQKSGKRFIGCSNYKNGTCDQTFPLPQKGKIIPLDRMCPFCGYQMMRIVTGRRGWETCVNWTKCPGRQDALKALEEKRGQGGKTSE